MTVKTLSYLRKQEKDTYQSQEQTNKSKKTDSKQRNTHEHLERTLNHQNPQERFNPEESFDHNPVPSADQLHIERNQKTRFVSSLSK